MKYYNNPLFCLAVLCLVVGIPAAVIHSFGDNSGDNSTRYEEPAPTESPEPSPSVQPSSTPEASPEPIEKGKRPGVVAASSPKPQNVAAEDSCGRAEREAAAAGWKLLSCDPLRIMPLEEWNTKSASSNFRWQPGLYCFDESNFAGVFQEQIGEPDETGYYPDWLSEVRLENGCSFFFHPTQGRENNWPAEQG